MRLLFSLGKLDQDDTPIMQALSRQETLSRLRSCALISQGRPSLQSDRQLLDDTIQLFDEALGRLDKKTDREARKMIDLLALSVVNRIREHLGQASTLELAPKHCSLCQGEGCPLQGRVGESGRSGETLGPGSGPGSDDKS